MRNCEKCGELLGETVQVCPYCGFSASDKVIRELRLERIKRDMVYEEYELKMRDRKNQSTGFWLGWLFGRSSR